MKKILIVSLIMIPFYGCSISGFFFSPDPVKKLAHDIDAIICDSSFNQTTASIKVVSLDKSDVLYERNSALLLQPASTMKMFTAAAALNDLGAGFSYATNVYADTIMPDGTIPGMIYIKGFGDPNLTTSDLDSLAVQVKAKGVTRILNGIDADVSFFDDQGWAAGWMWDDEPDPDEAFISPLSVNKNCIKIRIAPNKQSGLPATIATEPQTAFVQITNQTITVSDSIKIPLKLRRPSTWPNTIIAEGEVVHGDSTTSQTVSVRRPELYAAELLMEALLNHGISLNESMTVLPIPGTAKEIATIGHRLDSVLTDMLKNSDNLSAENTLKNISAINSNVQASSKAGIAAVNKYISSLGIDTTKYHMADGSGVSRYNLLSSDIFIQFLRQIYRHKDIFPVFYNALPIAGIDGTLKSRMSGTKAQGNLRAKTGTLNGVCCLAGYVTTISGEHLAFSIMMENYLSSSEFFRSAQDRIGVLLASFRRTQSHDQ